MQTLLEFMNRDRLKKYNLYNIQQVGDMYYMQVPERLEWQFDSHYSEEGEHIHIEGRIWYAATDGEIVMFWTPDEGWCILNFISELDNKNAWSLIGCSTDLASNDLGSYNKKVFSDPEKFCKEILATWRSYAFDHATFNEWEKTPQIPKEAYKYIDALVKTI